MYKTLALTVAGAGLLFGGLSTQADLHAQEQTVQTARSHKNDEITFYFGLKRREGRARAQLQSVSDPASDGYRQFVDPGSLPQYGARPASRRGLAQSARSAGLTVSMDSSAVFARVTGTVGEMEAWLGRRIRVESADGLTMYWAQGAGLAEGISPFVKEAVTVYQSQKGALSASAGSTNNGTWVGGCPEAEATGAYSFRQLNKAYGRIVNANNRKVGGRLTFAILSGGEGYSDASLALAADCFNTPVKQFTRIRTDGLRGPLPPGAEGDLDTQVAQAMLPRGSTVYYIEQADSEFSGALWFTLWAKVLELPELPQAASFSYGACEQDYRSLTRSVFRKGSPFTLTDSVLLRLGLVGVSSMTAAGDTGSSGCAEEGSEKLAVSYPASSPYMTAVGGSLIELRKNNTRKREVVWNQGPIRIGQDVGPGVIGGAGGGGQSIVSGRPWYQSGNGSRMRTVPDVSAFAAPAPGWPIHSIDPYLPPDSQVGDVPVWFPIGGTSAASPYFASAVAIMAAREAKRGRPPFGLVNPALYEAPAAAFHDITRTNNDLYGKGCCRAKVGYDWASGWGAPNFRPLYAAFRDVGVRGNG